MTYIERHPENLGAALLVFGAACFIFRKKIAELRAPPAKERIVAIESLKFMESAVKVSAIFCIAVGVLLIGLKWYFALG